MSEICRKDSLTRNMSRMLKMFPKEYAFYPKAWCLPAEYVRKFNLLLLIDFEIVIMILLNIVRKKNIRLIFLNLMLVVKVEEYL
jgi:hypothetical protein